MADEQKSQTEQELEKGRELQSKEKAAQKEASELKVEEAKIDGKDGFQRYQEKRTEEELEKQREQNPDSRNVAMSAGYSPPGTLKGTDGSNANFNSENASDPNAEWDPHGGEQEQSEGGEPKKRPE